MKIHYVIKEEWEVVCGWCLDKNSEIFFHAYSSFLFLILPLAPTPVVGHVPLLGSEHIVYHPEQTI